MTIINLTPHDIHVVGADGQTVVFPASGVCARVSSSDEIVGELDLGEFDLPVVSTAYGRVEGIPESGMFLVSAMVLAQLGEEYRNRAFAPDTGKTAVRNDAGQVVAVRQFRTV